MTARRMRCFAATPEEDDEFVVTDAAGNLLEDDALAQEILDDFLAFAEEDGDAPGQNGEPK